MFGGYERKPYRGGKNEKRGNYLISQLKYLFGSESFRCCGESFPIRLQKANPRKQQALPNTNFEEVFLPSSIELAYPFTSPHKM